MSGGVDSSVAALLLQQQGYEVIGVTMKLYSLDETELPPDHQGCCTLDDVEDARSVCRKLGIRHYVVNLEREFQSQVMELFHFRVPKGADAPSLHCLQRQDQVQPIAGPGRRPRCQLTWPPATTPASTGTEAGFALRKGGRPRERPVLRSISAWTKSNWPVP